jgi:hypothetical protein
MNFTRPDSDPSKYDLESVMLHETDEMLGIGGAGSALNQVIAGAQSSLDPPGPLDLFRFSAPGVVSYSTSTSATAYFSINGGVTNIAGFNQNGATDNSDMGDWVQGGPVLVQNAYGTPGAMPNLATPELDAFQVVGYNLAPAVPAPDPLSVIGTCLFMAGCPGWLRKLKSRRCSR